MGYSNQEVTHLWASGNKDSASSNHGNVYFTGRKLYNYGSHFMLGYRAAPGVVFLNSDGYSISTSKHKGYASSASRHCTQFYVPKLQDFADFIDVVTAHRANPRKGADLKALRARVERKAGDFIAAHPTADRDGLAWLFEQAGVPAERLALIARKVDRVKARKLTADTKEAVATWRANGRKFAEMSSSAFAGTVNAIRHGENEYRAKADLEALGNDLRLAHKQANADGHNRRKAILWGRLSRVRAAVKAMESAGVSSYVNRGRLSRAVRAIAYVRELERILRDGTGVGANVPGPKAFESAASHVQLGLLVSGAHMPPATRERLESYLARLIAARDARAAVINAERFQAEQDAREAWISGESSYGRTLSDETGGALIRARDAEIDGCAVVSGELETSHGARVPLAHAARIFAFVRRLREAGKAWEANPAAPVRVGHYSLDRVESSGSFVAGCHRINWGEIERLARELGLWDCAPDALETATDASDAE